MKALSLKQPWVHAILREGEGARGLCKVSPYNLRKMKGQLPTRVFRVV